MRIPVPRTRLWFIAFLMVTMEFIPSKAKAGYREDAFKKLVDYMRTTSAANHQARITDLHRSFLNTTLDQDKKIISLSLGVHYLESSPKLALQYLTSARLICDEKDPLFPMLTYYLGVAKLKTGSPEQAQNFANQIQTMDVPAPLKKLALILAVEATDAKQNYEQLHNYFEALTSKFSLGRKLENVAQKAIVSLEKKGNIEKANELSEDLARSYPNTPGSRWAFRRLMDQSCDMGKYKPVYVYSWRFLKQLARNINPDNGLEEFIEASIEGLVKLENEEVRRLTTQEKVEFLVEAHLYKKALVLQENLYQKEKQNSDSKFAPEYLANLGRIELKLNEPYIASAIFSKFLMKYPTHYLNARVNEFLGDALRYAGTPGSSAQTYAQALTKKDSRILRWYYFWMLYRSGDYTQARNLIEKKGYLEVREGDDPLVLEYWHGRILEKEGEKEEAEAIFRNILKTSGNTFYAAMIAAKYPHLLPSEESSPDQGKPAEQKKPLALAAKLLPGQSSFEDLALSPNVDIKYAKELIRGGLRDLAYMHLQNINWGKVSDPDSLAALSRLAYMVGDYNPNRRSHYGMLSAMRGVPSDYEQLLKHQKNHNSEWRLFYPVAYEKIVYPVAKGIKISPYLVLSIMRAESFYNRDAHSPVGAFGLMQLMPYTAIKIANLLHDEEFDMLELGQPEINISYGAYYLDRLVRYYSGNPYVAVAAYNAGPIAVGQWLASCSGCEPDEFVESIPYRETRRYVREVMRNYVQYSRIYLEKPEPLPLVKMPSQLPDEEIF